MQGLDESRLEVLKGTFFSVAFDISGGAECISEGIESVYSRNDPRMT